ncbi:hypothetical protein P8452_21797 [Trifolium repens]|nr:hypothetical protein P8452_21797 [Trifolium repens]
MMIQYVQMLTEGGIPSTFTPSNSSMNTPVKSALNGSQAPPSNPNSIFRNSRLYRMVVKSEYGRELRAFNFKEEDESTKLQSKRDLVKPFSNSN